MKYLLYCIFQNRSDFKRGTIVGFEGQPVSAIVANGLLAAFSGVADFNPNPEISQILAYHKVIESFHRCCTVIPIRYGCLFEEESQIRKLLEDRDGQYGRLLDELEGCVEMGIRALIPNSEVTTSAHQLPISQLATHDRPTLAPGHAFLATRKARYAQLEQPPEESRDLIERCRAAFAGLFLKFKLECPAFRTPTSVFRLPLLSLYFLVPRSSLEAFRKIFRQVSLKESARLLLTGPWPPYNFV